MIPSIPYLCHSCSRLTYGWMTPLFTLANKRSLVQGDLYGVAAEDDVVAISGAFERILADRLADPARYKNPVRSALWAQFRWPFIRAGILKLCNSTLNFAPSLLLWQLLEAIQSGGDGIDWHGFAYAGIMFAAMTIRTVIENSYFQQVTKVGFHCRSALSTAVYRKALRMSPVARQDTPVGQIVNLMQLDAQRIDTLIQQLHTSWDSWYQIAGYMAILGLFLGPSCLAGLLCMVLLMPVQGLIMARMQTLRRAITIVNDQRIKVTNEVLQVRD